VDIIRQAGDIREMKKMDPELRLSELIQAAVADDDKKREKKTKRKNTKGHFRDLGAEQGFQLENGEFIGDASWLEVYQGCFVHCPEEWMGILFAVVFLCTPLLAVVATLA
jgi:hypothetical protein